MSAHSGLGSGAFPALEQDLAGGKLARPSNGQFAGKVEVLTGFDAAVAERPRTFGPPI